jgi:hypothetical protein
MIGKPPIVGRVTIARCEVLLPIVITHNKDQAQLLDGRPL